MFLIVLCVDMGKSFKAFIGRCCLLLLSASGYRILTHPNQLKLNPRVPEEHLRSDLHLTTIIPRRWGLREEARATDPRLEFLLLVSPLGVSFIWIERPALRLRYHTLLFGFSRCAFSTKHSSSNSITGSSRNRWQFEGRLTRSVG